MSRSCAITRLFAFLAVTTLFLHGSFPAYAKQSEETQHSVAATAENGMTLSYNVYAGGMRALQASLDLDMAQNDYRIGLDAKTQGLIGRLFPWEGRFTTRGSKNNMNMVPDEYYAVSVWKREERQTRMEFENGMMTARHRIDNGQKVTDDDFEEGMAKDALDMLTATVKLLQESDGNENCAGSVPVFDGRRRFNLHFRDAGTGIIHKNRYSIFHGAAVKCIIEVEPVMGFRDRDKRRGWMAVQNHTKERKKMPTFWLSRLTEDGPVVPVRMEISSEYGAVIAHLAAVQ